jgi:fructose-specific phosphotransferase system IIA component
MVGKNKYDIIKKMVLHAENKGRINNAEEFIEKVLKREKEFSTGIGFGIAIPHAKTNSVTEPFIEFAKVNNVCWDSLDSQEVDLVFLIGVNEGADKYQLKILAALSRSLMNRDFRESIRSSKNEDEIINILDKINKSIEG